MRNADRTSRNAAAAAAVALVCLATVGFPTRSHALPPLPPVASQQTSLVERVAVFGSDDRSRLPDRLKTLQMSIGLIFNERARTLCSAFCVADQIIATASHCLNKTAGETPPRPEHFAFARPGKGGQRVRIAGAETRAAGQHVMSGSTEISVRPPIDAARDWALIKLAAPICAGHVLPVRPLPTDDIIAAAEGQRMFQVGYHRDFGNWTLTYSRPCSAGRDYGAAGWDSVTRDFTDPKHLILHTCDTGGASSGSPLLIEGARGPEVVGINVGTYVQSQVIIENGAIVQRMKPSPVANTGVSAEAFAASLTRLRTAQIVTAAADVRAIQQYLGGLKHYGGPIDGVYGNKLRAAIFDYEQERGLPLTGLPTSVLQRRLEASK